MTFAGLPFTYVVLLGLVSVGGFIASLSGIYLLVSAIVGYTLLRGLAIYDPRILDIVFCSLFKTPVPPSWFAGKGIIYRA